MAKIIMILMTLLIVAFTCNVSLATTASTASTQSVIQLEEIIVVATRTMPDRPPTMMGMQHRPHDFHFVAYHAPRDFNRMPLPHRPI